jgi:hypothetical protein
MSENIHPVSPHHIPEDLNKQVTFILDELNSGSS